MKENNTYHEHAEDPKLPKSSYVNPFVVPDNYFEESARQITSRIQIEKQVNNTEQPFSVPKGYFEQLQKNILAQIKITTLSTDTVDFKIPEGYFEQLSSGIKNKIAEEALKAKVTKTGFSVPEDYFEQAASQIKDTVSLDKIKQSTEGGFTLEENYFDKLTAKINERVAQEITSTTISTSSPEETPIRRIGVNRWIKYASAACIMAILSLGIYFGLDSDAVKDHYMASEVKLDDIPDEELMDYLAMNSNSDDLLHFVEYIYQHDLDQDNEFSADLEDQDLEDYINYML